MNWESWSDFFAMGGYALYVWGALAMVFGAIACELTLLTLRARSVRAHLAARAPVTPGRGGHP